MQAGGPAGIGHLRGHHLLGLPDPRDSFPIQVEKGVTRVAPHHVKLWVVRMRGAKLFVHGRRRRLQLRLGGNGDCDAVEVRLEVALVLGRNGGQGWERNRPASVMRIIIIGPLCRSQVTVKTSWNERLRMPVLELGNMDLARHNNRPIFGLVLIQDF